jgi:hypothetical protein
MIQMHDGALADESAAVRCRDGGARRKTTTTPRNFAELIKPLQEFRRPPDSD